MLVLMLGGWSVVAADALPNLVLQSIDVTPTGTIYANQTTVEITVTWQKVGAGTTRGGYWLRLYLNGTEVSNKLYWTTDKGPFTVLMWNGMLAHGDWLVNAQIDADGQQAESNEDNNLLNVGPIHALVPDTNPPPVPTLTQPALGAGSFHWRVRAKDHLNRSAWWASRVRARASSQPLILWSEALIGLAERLACIGQGHLPACQAHQGVTWCPVNPASAGTSGWLSTATSHEQTVCQASAKQHSWGICPWGTHSEGKAGNPCAWCRRSRAHFLRFARGHYEPSLGGSG